MQENAMILSSFTTILLADRPDLVGRWAELHWREWGDEPGREQLSWWVEQAAKAVQRTRVPALQRGRETQAALSWLGLRAAHQTLSSKGYPHLAHGRAN